MIKIVVFILTSMAISVSKPDKIPQWFMQDLKNNVGLWITDNSTYQSETEKQSEYRLEWQWGVGKTSITGRLYGVIDGKNTQDYWQFRQYWDNNSKKGMLVQYGGGGSIGIGELIPKKNGIIENIQEFSVPSGQKWYTKHIITNNGKISDTISFDKNKEGKWIKNRHYVWHKVNNKTVEKTSSKTDLGRFSISLNVKDIKTSYAFYQNLGFTIKDSNIKQHWLVLTNGSATIGLFQGMFPQNTMTFNPIDARAIYEKIKKNNTDILFSSGLDKASGPASFSISDPDGNPILIDQH